jgi:hypothetical protein
LAHWRHTERQQTATQSKIATANAGAAHTHAGEGPEMDWRVENSPFLGGDVPPVCRRSIQIGIYVAETGT